ncbi:exodeoxyribonuclease VII small subunit [Desulfothermus sp.]
MEGFNFEDAMARLKEIVGLLEKEDISLDKAMDLYKEGCELAKKLREYIYKAKQQVEVYSKQLLEDNMDGSVDE